PLLGAEVTVAPGREMTLGVDPAFEHGVLVDAGDVLVEATAVRPSELGYIAPGRTTLTLTNRGVGSAWLVLLGGPPFGEEIVMWWNFVCRSHGEVVQAREDWMKGTRFGEVHGYDGAPLPAPELPNVPLKPRGRVR